jgi:hypothetical protein
MDPRLPVSERLDIWAHISWVMTLQAFTTFALLAGAWGAIATSDDRDGLWLVLLVVVSLAVQVALIRYYLRPTRT